ncbi:MAG: hypothetical protein KF752_13425 [Pirellulaceae bacterium]|nr:hypothetical protein [Pirellulaceae bacterium]
MKFIAHLTFLACCVSTTASQICSAEVNTSWKPLGQVKVDKNTRSGTIAFRPELTLEENNRRRAEHRDTTCNVRLELPSSQLESYALVDRPVQLRVAGQVYTGRVTGLFLTPENRVVLSAEIKDKTVENRPRLAHGETGTLSIGE